jgi:hypothetical protein
MHAPKPSLEDRDWAEVLRIFKPPWRILNRREGAVRIEDAMQRPILYIYHRQQDKMDWKKPTEEEALILARAIARMSKR